MDITYRFVATGQGDVEKAFTGIEAAAKRQKKAVDDASKAVRQGAARGPTTDGERAARAQERATARAATQADRGAKRAADAQIRETERAQKHVARIRDKHFADEQRKDERASRERTKLAERAAQQAARKETAARERAQKESSGRRAQSFGVLKDIGSGAFLGAVGTGAALIGAAAKDALDLQEASARIAINSRKSGEQARNPNELRRSFEQTAMATPGVKAIDIADAVGRFVSLTGDVDTALKSQGTFATVASATGGNVGDIAEAAASLSQQFDIKGIEDMRDALAALTFQGKEGSFELKDAAAQFQRLAASGAAFGIPKGVAGVKTLGGLTQIARSGTGSAEQAATAVENLLTNLKVKQKELKASGVDVFDSTGKARDVRDLVVESISKVGGGDIAKKNAGLTKIFGEQGIRAINPLVAKYTSAFQGTAGTEEQKTAAGIAALRAEIERSINAPGTYADVVEDAAMAQKDASALVSNAWETIKAKAADSLLPAMSKMAESINAGTLDPFIEAVGLAADALAAFADFVGAKTPKTKEQITKEQRALAEKAAKKFDAKAGIGPLTPEMQAARDSLFIGADAAYRDQWGIPEDGGKKQPMSRDEWVDAYLAAGDGSMARTGAETIADRAARPDGSVLNNDWFMDNFTAETPQQRDMRQQRSAEATGQKVEAEFDTKAAQEAADAFARTVVSVNAAIAAAGQPSNI